MKTIVKFVLVAIMAIATTGQAFAQPQDKKQQQQQRMSREQFAEMQARHIADEMAFDDATTKKFVEAYLDCQKEVWALHPQRPPRDKGNKDNKPQSMTEEQTEKAIKERFEQSQKLLDIRQKYYKEYSKFLSQKQIERVYQIEQKMMRKLNKRGKAKDGQRPRPQQQPQQQQK